MMLTALYGAFMGTSIRGDFEEKEKEYQHWLLHYEKVVLEVAKAGHLRILNGEKLNPADFDPLFQQQNNNETQK